MMILKVTKKQCFALSLEDVFLETPKGEKGSQTDLRIFL